MTEIPQTDNDTLRLHVKSLEILAKARGKGGDQTAQQDIESAVAVINALARERDDMAEGCRDAENLAHDRLADIEALSLKLAESDRLRAFWEQDSKRMGDICASNSKQFELLAADYAAARDKLAAARLESKYLINIPDGLPAILDFERIEKELKEFEEEKAIWAWLDDQTRKSSTGISFDYCRYVEDGRVLEKGFRYMRHHHLGERSPTIREAVTAAMKNTNK